MQWQSGVAGEPPPVIQSDDVVTLQGLFDDVRAEQHLLSQITLAAIVPLIVLALLMLYVLGAAAAEARRPEVALAEPRGHSSAPARLFALERSLDGARARRTCRGRPGRRGRQPCVTRALAGAAARVTPQAGASARLVALAAVVAPPWPWSAWCASPSTTSPHRRPTRRRVASKLTLLRAVCWGRGGGGRGADPVAGDVDLVLQPASSC